ncbi:MAG: DUF4388 domain-containing protein [Verrucomicrobiota bacterium]
MNTASDGAQRPLATGLSLLFLTGKSIGQCLPLEPGNEWVIGRGKAAHIVLDDEKSSRRHSRLFFENNALTVEDLGSSNGTLVNGKRITKTALKDGDQIRIGNSVFKVAAGLEVSSAAQNWWEQTQHLRRSKSTTRLIAGSLESVTLVDLLQLLATSQKTGVLVIERAGSTGRIHLKDGQIHHASIDGQTATQAEKSVFRLLRWTAGEFEFSPEDREKPGTISEPTQSLLLEGVRQADEMTDVAGELPELNTRLRLARPLPEPLATLASPELEMLQLVYERETVLSVLDHFPGPDADAYKLLAELQKRGLIEAAR